MRKAFDLYSAQQAGVLLKSTILPAIKAHLMAGTRLVLEVKTQTKTRSKEQQYHAMIGDIAKQIGGDLADPEDAKRILVSAFRIDTREMLANEWAEFGDLRMGRGLRGEVVVLGVQTRKFTQKLAVQFCHWLDAFGAEQGVKFAASKWMEP